MHIGWEDREKGTLVATGDRNIREEHGSETFSKVFRLAAPGAGKGGQ